MSPALKAFLALILPPFQVSRPPFAAITKLYEAYHILVRNDWLDNLEALHRRYGPVVRIGPNELHFNDHEFCLAHHRRPDLGKCTNYYGLLDTLLGGLASPHRHTERKSIMQPLFSGATLSQFSATTMNSILDSLHNRLTDASRAVSGPVNATHYLWAYTNDIMVSYLVGEDKGYLGRDLQVVHDELRAFSAIELATVLRTMPIAKKAIEVFPALRQYSPLAWLDNLVLENLKPMMKSYKDPEAHHEKDRQSVLARLWTQLGQDAQIVAQEAAQALFIGNESLLSNLTFLLHNMMKNPGCIAKLRAELDNLDVSMYGHRIWRDFKVLRLLYLDTLCRESTRLSSPGWHRQPRQTAEPVDYKGTVIPPMTSMRFTLHMLEHDPLLYPEPNSFKSDRWLSNDAQSQKAMASSVTFGTGTRTCLGQFIARQVLRKTLAGLVYNFNFSLCEEGEGEGEGESKKGGSEFPYLTTYPRKWYEGFMHVRLTPRFQSI
ncbi:cytochrome P450 [Lasiosphaeria miniovina]|uniref:Cytochrome P450 n=1 Tax=Lasiosphaeria miniovina TaxID=1954250 RepID=A0AA40B4K5_9PEZI|nr:cytochrome P450 [Lasiosphaeria miniovina]KAK0727601.1 cytochrome P450 [Lasiosphaeria miniovina]